MFEYISISEILSVIVISLSVFIIMFMIWEHNGWFDDKRSK